MESRNYLVYLNTEDILPHPKNPRKELGDLTEMAESIKAKPRLPGGMDFTDLHKGDDPLEELKFQMSLGGDELHLFRDSAGALLVIKSAYRKPFDSWKEVECYKRIDGEGRPYVAVMNGCILRGLIYPYKIGEQLVETLGAVYNAAGVAAEQEQMKI